ncbi:MAG: hypothetical protein LBT29_00650 [Flavobacteriaceae bacterium]|jgi:hypothetical protein|nr:hypothetical protein [Flavobacteriaceae bacterium]
MFFSEVQASGFAFMSEPQFSQDLKDCQDFKNQQNNPAKLNKIKIQDNAGKREGCPYAKQNTE